MSLARTVSGLLYQSDGSLTGWTNGGNWTAPNAPAYVPFDSLAATYGPSSDPAEAMGCREAQAYVENSVFYLWYDAGPSNRAAWSNFLATSSDGGKTWQPRGQTSEGTNKATSGTWAGGVFAEWMEKRGSTYVRHRAPSRDLLTSGADVAGLGGGPYTWDQWTATSPYGPWTAAAEVPLEPATWANVNKACNSVVFSGGTYYAAVSSGLGTAGYATCSTPTGNYSTVGGSQTVLQNPRSDMSGWVSEGASWFFSPTFSLWCMLGNGYQWDGSNASQFRTALFLSSSLTDWSVGAGGVGMHLQKVCPMDCTAAPSGARHLTGPDGTLIYDATTGYVPITIDADAELYGPDVNGWHFRRRIRFFILEPSVTPLRYLGSADTTSRTLTRTLSHGNMVMECGARLNAVNGAGGSLTIEYRSDGAGNAYRARLAASGVWSLYKVVGNTETLKATGSGSLAWAADPMISRLKVSVIGNVHTLTIDGESQVTFTDSSSPIASGTTFASAGKGVDCDVRCLSCRTSDTVTVTGLPPGTSVDVMGYCGIFAGSAVADGSGVAAFTHSHYPLASLRLGGTDYPVAGGIWGGDTLAFSGLPTTSAVQVRGLLR